MARQVSTKAVRTARVIKDDIDPIFDDTGKLSLADVMGEPQGEDPYDTAAWILDPEHGLKRADRSEKGGRVSRSDKATDNNPAGQRRRESSDS